MSDKGKCTKCRFVKDDFCNVGSYYAEEFGTNSVCFEGELWEAIEKLPTTNKVQKFINKLRTFIKRCVQFGVKGK